MKKACLGFIKVAEVISTMLPMWLYITGIVSIYLGTAEFSYPLGMIVLGVLLIVTAFLFSNNSD